MKLEQINQIKEGLEAYQSEFDILSPENLDWVLGNRGEAVARFVEAVKDRHLIIDCDAEPFCPEGYYIESHQKRGKYTWNPKDITLFLSKEQQNDDDEPGTDGCSLWTILKNYPTMNANVLDYLFANLSLIPEAWKKQRVYRVYFWGTIYCRLDQRHCFFRDHYVRSLCWEGKLNDNFPDEHWWIDCSKIEFRTWYNWAPAVLHGKGWG